MGATAGRESAVAIVGGGASGAFAAIAIGGRAGPVTVFEPRPLLGRGWAYATDRPEHLLNVPAGRLSALDDRPDDFVEWCTAEGIPVDGDAFVPRAAYGQYLGARVDGHAPERVVDIVARSGKVLELVTSGGRIHRATDVVLATGYGHAPGRACGRLVLCTGVIGDDWTTSDPLLGRLAERGLVRAAPCGIGPLVERGGRVVGDDRSAGPIWAVGPLRRAAEWEATAIPEIRRHANEVAAAIVGRMR